MSDLVTDFERDRRFRITRVGAPERLTTNEGEPAALVTIDGLLLEAPVQRTVGYVITDDFYSRVDGLALQADAVGLMARIVRTLTQNDTFALGNVWEPFARLCGAAYCAMCLHCARHWDTAGRFCPSVRAMLLC